MVGVTREASWDFLHVNCRQLSKLVVVSLRVYIKNYHKFTREKQLELINSLINLDKNFLASHFNKFFLIFSESLSLTSPPAGKTHRQMKNLILAAAEKSDKLGACKIR
ncbi:hypothetical protein VP01_1633g1 [Puccinia sorghi]|uniref:Uncharacterized protein n=1 Tax=Puccinia sorghi TaxID=27349 RepID=A0A0L6VGS4_9BASI|nr:hypothetical protein VP01_1633g1 [Puccinia sorghi]